jgi:hypothetical protein
MVGVAFRLLPLGLTLGLVTSGCALLDADPTRVTMAELLTGAYDPDEVTGFDVDSMGVELPEAASFCEAVGLVPLRWTVDALVPMQVWVDTYGPLTDVPDPARPSVEHLVEFTERRLRWSLTGEGERPVWDAETVAAAEVLIDVALATCPDLPMVVGFPGQSDRPSGWADMSDAEVADHCASMARRFEEDVAAFEADYGRPPRHHMEMDLPVAYYGTDDWHGIATDADGRPQVVPVPGGGCDL